MESSGRLRLLNLLVLQEALDEMILLPDRDAVLGTEEVRPCGRRVQGGPWPALLGCYLSHGLSCSTLQCLVFCFVALCQVNEISHRLPGAKESGVLSSQELPC